MDLIHGSRPNEPDIQSAEDDLMHAISLMRAMVDRPDQFKYEFVKTERTIILKIETAKKDFGKIIGKSGRTINALRLIINNISAKHGVKTVIEVKE